MSQPHSGFSSYDLVCLSHLRWKFVFQRPQHLLTRCAAERRVFFFEEPVFEGVSAPRLQLEQHGKVTVATPYVPHGLGGNELIRAQRVLLDGLLSSQRVSQYVLWYYTPMALGFSDHLRPQAIVYDCMDELSAFKFAPPELKRREAELMRKAAVVFTGGQSLYEAKRDAHPNIHPFPSSVDIAHFGQARRSPVEPADQRSIPHPRLGFFGVIDERMDLELLRGVAMARPDWHLVLLGPIVKIDADALPQAANIHYLGSKQYEELPAYVASWDVALLPFARNESTRFISPTKTPEYMAAGKPVVSTSIRDVVRPYGQLGLVRIADEVDDFVAACDAAMTEDPVARTREADAFLRQTSWDGTWARMRHLVDSALPGRATVSRRAAEAI
jgi:UDP-galactopyranose mutase